MEASHVVYIAPNLESWVLSSSDNKTYTKELIYVGEFVKGDLKFSVDESLLHHWVSVFNEMKTNGVEVPIPLEHTQDPEKQRGKLVSLSVAKNKKGISALFGGVQFRDNEAEKLALTAQTSIYVPPEFQDGKGHKYTRPIQHVALTSYPVVPGLEEFQVIAASFKKEESKMSLKTLIQKLGLKVPEDASKNDEATIDFVVTKWKGLKTQISKLKAGSKPEEKPTKNEKPEEKPTKNEKPTVSAAFVGMAKEHRELKLSNLVLGGHITPAVCDKLKEKWCTEERITLALSSESNDGFDDLVDTLAENDPVVLREQTGPQDKDLMSLSNRRNDTTDNPLIKDAERRAEEARKGVN